MGTKSMGTSLHRDVAVFLRGAAAVVHRSKQGSRAHREVARLVDVALPVAAAITPAPSPHAQGGYLQACTSDAIDDWEHGPAYAKRARAVAVAVASRQQRQRPWTDQPLTSLASRPTVTRVYFNQYKEAHQTFPARCDLSGQQVPTLMRSARSGFVAEPAHWTLRGGSWLSWQESCLLASGCPLQWFHLQHEQLEINRSETAVLTVQKTTHYSRRYAVPPWSMPHAGCPGSVPTVRTVFIYTHC
jgi:hypothetical protein